MERPGYSGGDQRTQKLKEFHKKVKLTLNDTDRDHLYSSLKKYQAERKLDKLLHSLKTILDTPVKLDLLKEIRGFIPPHQVGRYDEEVPYHNMAHKWKSRSMMNLNTATTTHGSFSTNGGRAGRLSQPSSTHNTPLSPRRHGTGGSFVLSGLGPVVKMLSISLLPGERLGFCVRGGSEHGLGIFVSEVEDESAAERCGLLIGDQIIEVNSISFDNIAGSSAVKVLTGSERLKVMVRRVGKIPGFKSTKEKIAWYDVHQRRLVRGDPAAQHVLELPGSMGLVSGHERKINLNKPTKNRPHLGFNVRGGAEFGLGIYVSRTDPGGLAEENGLRVGEELLEVNGVSVRDKTHEEAVTLIKQQKSLIITVRDVGRYPAFKEIYAEYKWVDVNTGRITRTQTSGHIKSVAIRSPVEDMLRQPFSESHISRLSDTGDDSDGLDDVLMHLEPEADPEAALHYGLALQEEKELHGDFIHQTPLSQKRSGLRNRSHMTRSLDNIHHHCQMSTVVPVSSMTKSSSQNDLSFNGYSPSSFSGEPSLMNGHIHRPHTPLNTQKGKPGGLWDSNDTTDEESGDRLFYKRPKSAMESAMEFSSIHDIHIASNNNSSMTFPPESDNESAVIPRRRSDVIMMQRGHDVEESLTKTSVHRDRSRSQHRSSLAVQALQNEARRSHPQLANESQKEETSKATDTDSKTDSRRSRSVDQESSGSKSSSKSRSIRERLFGSRSKDRDKPDKKKYKKSRKPLRDISFDNSDRENENKEKKYKDIKQQAKGLLSTDEIAAVLRHLNLYFDDENLFGLTQRVFAILDSTAKMKLCTQIRDLIKERDKKAFDSAVNDQFDSIVSQNEQLHSHQNTASSHSKVISKPPVSKDKVKVTPKRVKRKAPPPPVSPSINSSNLSDLSTSSSIDTRNRLETSPEASENKMDSTDTSQDMSLVSSRTILSDKSSINSSVMSSDVSMASNSQHVPISQATAVIQGHYYGLAPDITQVSKANAASLKAKAPSIPKLVSQESQHYHHHRLKVSDSLSGVPAPAPPPPPPPPIPFSAVLSGSPRASRWEGRRKSLSGSTSSTGSHSTGSCSTMVRVDVHQQDNVGKDRKSLEEISNTDVRNNNHHSEVIKYGSETDLTYKNVHVRGSGNFKDLASQKLEEFKRRSCNGSRDSLHSPKSDEDIGNSKRNVMSELQLHLKKRMASEEQISSQDTTSSASPLVFKGGVKQSDGNERDSGLVEVNYMDSESLFPALTNSRSTMASDRGIEASQSESVLQATQALAFLDTMETDSQFELSSISHVVTPRSEISHLMTPRSDVSSTSAATSRFGSYDVNPDISMTTSSILSLSQSSSLQRSPPRFIAPPPPSEPPPSEDEEDAMEPGPYSVDGPEGSVHSRKPSDTDSVMTSASDMASLRSYRKLTDDGNTVIYSSDTNENKGGKHISNGTNGYNFNSVNERQNKSVVTNGYDSHHETDGLKTSSNSRVTKKQLSQQKSPSPGTPKDAQATSWLFKDKNVTVKPKDSSALGPSGGEKVKEKQLVDMDSTDTEVDEKKDSVMVYLDKSFKTMGLSISGGTDSKVQPEIKVKAVFPGGAAEAEGTLKPGMQILAIDDTSLVKVTHMRAVVTIKKSFEYKSRPLMAMEVKL